MKTEKATSSSGNKGGNFKALGTREAKAEKKVWDEFWDLDLCKELKHRPWWGGEGVAGPGWVRKHSKGSRVPSSTSLSY